MSVLQNALKELFKNPKLKEIQMANRNHQRNLRTLVGIISSGLIIGRISREYMTPPNAVMEKLITKPDSI